MLVNKGFTLIELLIAIAITGILASIAVPAFTAMIATTQVKSDASNLHFSLLRARSEAVKRNTSITLAPVGGGWKYGWTISNNIQTQGAAKTDITGPASVIYNANGRAAGGAVVSFDVSSPKTTTKRCVTISLSGMPVVKLQGC